MMRASFLYIERKLNVGFQTGLQLDAATLHRCVQWRRNDS